MKLKIIAFNDELIYIKYVKIYDHMSKPVLRRTFEIFDALRTILPLKTYETNSTRF